MGVYDGPEENVRLMVKEALGFAPRGKKPSAIYFQLWDHVNGNSWSVYELRYDGDFDRHWYTHPVQTFVWCENVLYMVAFRRGVSMADIEQMVTQYHTGKNVQEIDFRA